MRYRGQPFVKRRLPSFEGAQKPHTAVGPRQLGPLVVLLGLAWFALGASAGPDSAWAATSSASGDLTSSSLDLQPCHIDNLRQEVLCGRYTVFEDREAGSGRQIDIHLAVMPAVDEDAEPDPLVLFAGGPGQSAISLAPLVRQVFRSVNQKRDLVFIDQRGIGASHPLACEQPDDAALIGLSTEELDAVMRDMLAACLDALDADVTLYTQDIANQDIHEILRALGYGQVNLWGASWGTRSALLYAHQFPDHVRTIVLDGALPLVNTAPLHAAADGTRALEALFADCAADVHCGAAFPDLEADFQTVMDDLGEAGREVHILDATRGEPQTMVLTTDRLGDALRSILYMPDLSRTLPLLIHRASRGDYRPLSGVFGTLIASSADGLTLGASLTMFCSEELARFPEAEVETEDPTGAPAPPPGRIGDAMLNNLQNACSVWPKAPLPSIYGEDVTSNAPTLVLSGDLDPITPPSWGQVMADGLSDALHLVAPSTGHNVSPHGCAPSLIAQLVEQGSLDGIDGSCLESLRRPTFFVDFSGPAAGPADKASERSVDSDVAVGEEVTQ